MTPPEPTPEQLARPVTMKSVLAMLKGAAQATAEALQERDDRIAKLERRLEQKSAFPYAGCWKDGTAYKAGEFATFRGGLWYAHIDNSERPGTTAAWQLAVRSGDNR